jgi:D-serine deaminase-like pyridoxal phosphate-dependent protein
MPSSDPTSAASRGRLESGAVPVKPFLAAGGDLGAPGALDRPVNVLGGDFLLPIMVLKQEALRHNLALMARYCTAHDVSLAPHGKTTMSPELIGLQLAAGAWGVTAATAGQVRVFRSFGVSTILLANQLVEPAAIAWVMAELDADPSFRFLCLADSLAGVEIMAEAVRATGSPSELEVMVELGVPGGRTGCRTTGAALEVAAAIAAAPGLRLAGVECYEGTIGEETLAATLDRVDAFLSDVRGLAETLDARGSFAGGDELIVSAGGSAYFDRVVEQLGHPWTLSLPVRLVIRSGCYITHDSAFYRRLSPLDGRAEGEERFLPAIEVWGAVVSRPEPDLAIVGFGKRDVPYDLDLPTPTHVRRRSGEVAELGGGDLEIVGLNDQHAYVRGDCGELAVGDWVGCGISHPCTAFDKWRQIPVVDDAYTVVDLVHTFF